MKGEIIRSGCLPYADETGYKITITIEAANDYFGYERVRLNPDSDFVDFDIEKWPEVKAAIDRAIKARRQLDLIQDN